MVKKEQSEEQVIECTFPTVKKSQDQRVVYVEMMNDQRNWGDKM